MPTRKSQKSEKSNKITTSIKRIQDLEQQMSQMIREMQEKMRQLECLNEFSSLMNSSLEIDEVRKKALEAICKLVGCEIAIILFFDKDKGELYLEAPSHYRLAIDDQSIAGYVAMTNESLTVNDVQNDSRQVRSFPENLGRTVKTLVCLPLRAKNKMIGVIQAINKLPSAPARPSRHTWPDFYDHDRKILETLSHSISIAVENSQLYAQIKRNFFETVEALAEAIEKKDRYTGGHTKRVVYYSMCICKYLNLAPEQLEQIRLGAILHDVGKIGIEDKILKKKAPLDPDEWKVMQTHPELGYDILRRVEGLKEVMGGMRYHHERWDGSGYPLGLKGEEIPLLARVISLADAYDAMASTRPYRKGLDPKLVFEEIVKCRGTQFDPLIVDAFVEAFKYEKMGKGSGGSTLGTSGEDLLSNCD